MGLSGILFNPQGRIGPGEFWRGLIVLIGLSIVMSVVSVYAPMAIAGIVSFAGILLIYPLICVYGKRFHDNGRTAWLVLVVLIGYIAASVLLTMILTPIVAPNLEAAQMELSEKMVAGEIGFAELMAESQALSGGPVLIMQILVTLVASLLAGFFVARLESDPDENEHGPPTIDSIDSAFE